MTITPATHAISINPATGEQLSVLPWAGVDDIENALQLAAAGFRDWREANIDYRAEKLRDIGKALRARSEEMAQMITREMGKPINQARAEVAKSANLCDWYAEHGPAMLKAEPTLVENQQAVIEYRPLGTILAIMPWNFPLWQVMRGAVPIILAGNGYLLKHAPNVMGCAQLIAQVFKDAGIPQGVYGWLNADNDGVSLMIKDSRIAAVTVTGSVRAGAAIGAQAGAALKKCVLELGGSDPFIVLNDADLELAVKAAVAGRYQNTGQVCAAAKRFIIEEGIASAFTERFVAAAAALKMGDPRDEENALGPMARFDLRDELHHQVEKTLAQGARLLLGGEKMAGAGNYYPPTVLANVTPEMTAFLAFPLPALIWCAVRYTPQVTCLLTFVTGAVEVVLVANSVIDISVGSPFSIPQMFSARLGIATMAICPIMVSFSVAAINSLMKQVALRADFDFLTQVYSRSGLYEALKSPSLKQTQHLTVMLLDIDYFKSINDNYGHECGDKVLSVFAQHIQKIVGDKGLVARMGGEEFAVAVPSVNPVDGLLMAEKIRKGVELQPFTWQQKTLYLTVSIGVGSGCASYRTLTDDFNKLMVEADTCLYRSKKDGRNRTSTMRYGEEVV